MRPGKHQTGGADPVPESGLARREPLVLDLGEDESVPPTKPSIAPPSGSLLFSHRPSPPLPTSKPVPSRQQASLARRLCLPLCGVGLGGCGLITAAATAPHTWIWLPLGLCALVTTLFGVASLVRLSRGHLQQLELLTEQVSRLARGEPGTLRLLEPSREVALLASRLRKVSVRLAQLTDELQQGQDERRTSDATAAQQQRLVDQENADLRRVLDRADRAVLSIDPQGKLSRQCSPVIAQWLGPVPHSGVLWDYLDQASEGVGLRFESAWGSALNRTTGQLNLQQMPRRLAACGRVFDVDYEPLCDPDGKLERVLVLLKDVSALERSAER